MAVRLRLQHQEEIRLKIRGSQLINLVQQYAFTGKYNNFDVEPKRIDAALGLLRKVVPDLASIEVNDRKEGWADTLRRLADQSRVIAEIPPGGALPSSDNPVVIAHDPQVVDAMPADAAVQLTQRNADMDE